MRHLLLEPRHLGARLVGTGHDHGARGLDGGLGVGDALREGLRRVARGEQALLGALCRGAQLLELRAELVARALELAPLRLRRCHGGLLGVAQRALGVDAPAHVGVLLLDGLLAAQHRELERRGGSGE